MTSQELLTILLIAVIVNAVLTILALLVMRGSRARRVESAEADVIERIAMASGQGAARSSTTVGAGRTVVAGSLADQPPGGGVALEPDDADDDWTEESPSADDSSAEGSSAEGSSADACGEVRLAHVDLETPIPWRRAVDDEVVRLARYHRPATIMFVELDGFDRFTDRLGEAAGGRLLVATARTLRAQARASDRCAQFDHGRFGILLPETDDIKAINFAERVRSECDRWLDAGEISMRVAIGWAPLDPVQGAGAAIEKAERRLDGERRHRAGSAA